MSAGAATFAFAPSCSSCKLEVPAEIPQEGAFCIATLLVHGLPGRARPELMELLSCTNQGLFSLFFLPIRKWGSQSHSVARAIREVGGEKEEWEQSQIASMS